jgi:hypothetical protein
MSEQENKTETPRDDTGNEERKQKNVKPKREKTGVREET